MKTIAEALDTSDLVFPVPINQVPVFVRKTKDIAINVFVYSFLVGYNADNLQDELYCAYVTEDKRKHHINLLLLHDLDSNRSHYVLIRESEDNPTAGLSRMLRHPHGQRYYCYYCLESHTSANALEEHVTYRSTLGIQRIKHPLEKKHYFNEYSKTLPLPFRSFINNN